MKTNFSVAVLILTVSTLLLTPSKLFSAIIDFESLEYSGDDSGPLQGINEYTEDGFVFTADNSGAGYYFLSWGTAMSGFAGSTGIFPAAIGESIFVVRENGGAFSALSIDLAGVGADNPGTAVISGSLGGNFVGLMSVPFGGSGPPTFQTFALLGLSNINLLVISGNPQIDNLVLSEAPEPTSSALAVSAAIGLAWLRRRRISRPRGSSPPSGAIE